MRVEEYVYKLAAKDVQGKRVSVLPEASRDHTQAVISIQEAQVVDFSHMNVRIQVTKHPDPSMVGEYWVHSKYLQFME